MPDRHTHTDTHTHTSNTYISSFSPSMLKSLNFSLSLRYPLFVCVCVCVCVYLNMSVAVFLLPSFYHFCGVGPPAYFSNLSPFSREHIGVGFKEFPSLNCWCIVIHCHQPEWPTPFQRARWDFMCVQFHVCTNTGPPVVSFIRED